MAELEIDCCAPAAQASCCGADVLISARRVGPSGHAIGIDMTDETLEQTRAHSKIEIADLVAALNDTQRREERELCKELRVQPRRLAEYVRRLSQI
jgi:hypothetical protein